MKRVRIGDTDMDVSRYWTNGKRHMKMRLSEVEIYSRIDLLQEMANVSASDEETDILYTEMDILFCTACMIDAHGANSDNRILHNGGIAINRLIEDGEFKETYQSLEERNIHVNNVISRALETASDMSEPEEPETEFIAWYREVVEDQNYYTELGTNNRLADVSQSAIGEAYNETLNYAAEIKKTGCYNLYIAVSQKSLTSSKALRKAAQQQSYLKWIMECGTNLNEATVRNCIKSGILQQTGKFPENALSELKRVKKVSGIGEPISAIVMAIVACLTFVVTLIFGIRSIVRENKLANSAPTEGQLQQNMPDYLDWGSDTENTDENFTDGISKFVSNNKKILGFALVGIIVWQLL